MSGDNAELFRNMLYGIEIGFERLPSSAERWGIWYRSPGDRLKNYVPGSWPTEGAARAELQRQIDRRNAEMESDNANPP